MRRPPQARSTGLACFLVAAASIATILILGLTRGPKGPVGPGDRPPGTTSFAGPAALLQDVAPESPGTRAPLPGVPGVQARPGSSRGGPWGRFSVPPPLEVPWNVEVRCGKQPLLVDLDGAFEADGPVSPGTLFEVLVPLGWTTDTESWSLDPSQAAGEQPISIELRRSEAIPFQLQALDAATQEPIPFLECRLRLGYQDAECLRGLTDREGVLEAEAGVPPGHYFLFLREPGEEWRFEEIELTHQVDAPIHHVDIPVGPTYTFEWDTPPATEIGDYRAILTPSTDLDMATNGLGWSARLRPGPKPWVRLRYDEDIEADIPLTRNWTLTVSLQGGGWVATGSTLEACGIVRDAVRLRSERTGSLSGRMLDPEGRPIVGDRHAHVGLDSSGGSYHYRWVKDGGFEFPNVRAGEWKLTMRAHGFASLEETVQVESHVRVQRDFTLESLPMAPPLRGPCESETGTWRGELSVWARHRGHSAVRRIKEEDWFQEDDIWVAEFELNDVALGTSQVNARVHDERLRCTQPDPLGNGQPLLIRVLDNEPCFELQVSVLDALTGEPLSPLKIHGLALPDALRKFRTELGDYRIPGVLCRPIDIRIFVPRYAPSEPVRHPRPETESVVSLQVSMQPGWGARVSVFEETPDGLGEELAGIAVTMDGVVAGTTDEEGDLWLASDRPPGSLGVSAPGWAIVPGWDVDPESGGYQVAPWGVVHIGLRRE